MGDLMGAIPVVFGYIRLENAHLDSYCILATILLYIWPSFGIDFSDSPSPNLFGITYRVIESLQHTINNLLHLARIYVL